MNYIIMKDIQMENHLLKNMKMRLDKKYKKIKYNKSFLLTR